MGVTKSVTVEELKENLRDYLAEVQKGATIYVVDDDKTVALFQAGVRYPTSNMRTGDIEPGPRPKNLKISSLDILLEDRHGSADNHE